MGKVWEIKDPDALLKEMATKRIKKQAQTPLPRPDEKDPGKAYSLSIFCWGGGQFYNNQPVKGAVFLVMMLIVVAGTCLSVIYREELLGFLHRHGMSTTVAFLGAEVLLLCVLLFWSHNAGDAYHGSVQWRWTPFLGVSSRVSPVLASLVFPGWGQFLNGQPIKGSIYTALAVLGIFSLLSLVATLLAWPYLEASDARFVAESVFAIALVASPLVPLIWTLSIHDAFKVSDDEIKKEPVWERIKAAYYRGRTQGWERGVFPHFRLTLLLVLVLVFVTIAVRYSFTRGFYIDWLKQLRSYLSSQGMTIVPELISRVLELLIA